MLGLASIRSSNRRLNYKAVESKVPRGPVLVFVDAGLSFSRRRYPWRFNAARSVRPGGWASPFGYEFHSLHIPCLLYCELDENHFRVIIDDPLSFVEICYDDTGDAGTGAPRTTRGRVSISSTVPTTGDGTNINPIHKFRPNTSHTCSSWYIQRAAHVSARSAAVSEGCVANGFPWLHLGIGRDAVLLPLQSEKAGCLFL